MDLSKRINRTVGQVGFELKHNPNPTQADIDNQSIRCVEEGFLVACEMLHDASKVKDGTRTPAEWAKWLEKQLEAFQLENLKIDLTKLNNNGNL